MDTTEDLSARILVKHILNAEPPRTPLTRSAAAKVSSGTRRSSRLNQNNPSAQTPQLMLRRSLKHKIRESISSKALPNKRRTASTVLKHTPGPTSMLFDDGDTPRQILKNILLTEPVKSPVINKKVVLQQPQPSPDSSLHSRRPSIEVSGLDLPDLTIGNIDTTVKRLNRKRPHRSLNVTAFEKRLRDGNEEAAEESLVDPSLLSLSSSSSLSLKTPFNDVRTERKALQRKGSHSRKVSVEDFGAAIDKREHGNYHGLSSLAPGQALGETAYSEGFTLGLSKLSEPDISMDIVNCNTALYAKTDAAVSDFSTLATQDKPTVMASQIQRDMTEKLNINEQPYLYPMEQDQDRSRSLLNHPDLNEGADENVAATSQSEPEKNVANRTLDVDDPTESRNGEKQSKLEEAAPQTEDDTGTGTLAERKVPADDDAESQSEQEPVVEQQNHVEDPSCLKPEEERTDSQTNEEEVEGSEDDAEEEEGDEESEEQGDEESEEQVEDNMGAVEDGVEENHEDGERDDSEEDVGEIEGEDEQAEAVEDGVEEVQGEAEGNEAEDIERDSQEDEKEQTLDKSEHITQKAQCPEGELIMPIQSTETDLPNSAEPGYSDDVPASPTVKDGAEVEADNSANKENAFKKNDSPDDVDHMEQSVEEYEEEEEDEEVPLKTPAFVKEKRNFFNLDPQASPFAPKTSQPGGAGPSALGAKPKQKAQRKYGSQKGDPGLPKSYLMNVFKHFAKAKVSADVYPVLKDIMDTFFDRLAKDLEAYAQHARRSTIEVADCELLLRRQGHVNDKVPVEVLIEKYLRMDQRKLLIPIATSGNVVFPPKR